MAARDGGGKGPAPDGGPVLRLGNFLNRGLRGLVRRRPGGGTARFDPSGTVRFDGGEEGGRSRRRRYCDRGRGGQASPALRSTLHFMRAVARILLWASVLATAVLILYVSHGLSRGGTDPHLVVWFSAGGFVLLGFPLSMYGIFQHLINYFQPHVQCYVVRILWMVPIYSIESWLCLRFHSYAVYIETLRDMYESFVLYSFFRFLIEVLGGEDALVMVLKDKSPTRGMHIWGFGLCLRPWLMGQPVSRTYVVVDEEVQEGAGGSGGGEQPEGTLLPGSRPPSPDAEAGGGGGLAPRTIKRVRWTSPFLVQCKRGILQYVLLKFVCSIAACLLEILGAYHEGEFDVRYGYFYVCWITNLSQCWALYCLVFFYYATKNELGPIRPVGKFLAVKALVFFTWWQSVGISMLLSMGLITDYGSDWRADQVAKGLQNYLICIEMFAFSIVHVFVFPHTDYLQPIGIDGSAAGAGGAGAGMPTGGGRRLGRRGRAAWNGLPNLAGRGDDRIPASKAGPVPDFPDIEIGSAAPLRRGDGNDEVEPLLSGSPGDGDDPSGDGGDAVALRGGGIASAPPSPPGSPSRSPRRAEDGARQQPQPKSHKPKGVVHAFLDSTLPKDVIDQSVELVKGDFTVEKKTLLSHAATSDEYDLFSKSSERRIQRPGRLIGKVGGGSGVPKRPRQPRLHNPGVPMMTTVKEQMAGAKSGKAQD